ncbi:MAG: MFS transporter [Clostridia bacterium]
MTSPVPESHAPLWRHPDFLKLWGGQTVSQFGAQITTLALPLTAVLFLHASAFEMGVLGALGMAPFLVVGLFLGVYVDRRRRRSLLIMADIGRTLLLAAVPVLYLIHRLSIGILYGEAFLLGSLTVLFDVAYQSYLPALIPKETLVDGNSKLEFTRAVAQIGGPGFAGFLAQWLTAPLALVANALTYVVSVVSLLWIRGSEPEPAGSDGQGVFAQIREGLQVVFGSRYLRAVAGCTGTANFFATLAQAVYVLYVVHRVGLHPGLLGVVFGVGSVGALVGAAASGRLASRFGVGPVILGGIAVSAVGELLVPLARAPVAYGLPFLVGGSLVVSLGSTVYNITQVSLRQALTPHRLMGRMNASMRFVVWGVIPLGSLAGGLLGSHFGLRPTLVVAALGGLLAPLWIALSPTRRLVEQPKPIDS